METMTLGLFLRIQAAPFVMTLSLQLHFKSFICIMLFWIGIVLPILLSVVGCLLSIPMNNVLLLYHI